MAKKSKDFKKSKALREKKPHYIPVNPFGAPSKYQDHYPEEVEKYLLTVGEGTCKMPKRCDVALLFNITDETLNHWEEKHEIFASVMRKVDRLQQSQLMDDGMYGGKEVNHQMAKFILSANHGMAEIEKKEFTGKDGKDLIPAEVKFTFAEPDES